MSISKIGFVPEQQDSHPCTPYSTAAQNTQGLIMPQYLAGLAPSRNQRLFYIHPLPGCAAQQPWRLLPVSGYFAPLGSV